MDSPRKKEKAMGKCFSIVCSNCGRKTPILEEHLYPRFPEGGEIANDKDQEGDLLPKEKIISEVIYAIGADIDHRPYVYIKCKCGKELDINK